jgi:multidrug efflux system outer membrane protein
MTTAGCSFIPEYKQPDLPVASTWEGKAPAGAESSDQAPAGQEAAGQKAKPLARDLAWQSYFESKPLQQLIALAMDNNRDLRVALLNIDKAKAAYRIQKADSLPVVAGSAAASRQGVAEDSSSTGSAYTSDTGLSANLGVTAYELDFFGRVKSLNQAALETYLATEEAAVSTRIALIAQTADAYLTLLADRKLLALAKDTFEAQQKTHDVIKSQYEVGSVTQLDLAQAKTAVESARVSIALYRRQMVQAENALTLLAGISAQDLICASETIDDIRFMENLPAGLPSQVLLARPDIRAAEHRLKAANADIGAARAALYPAISLTGSMGVASQSLTSLFDVSKSLAWSFTPSLSIPIFNREGLKAGLDSATISEKIAVSQYEGAVQTAFREVADQLAARKTYRDQLAAQEALVRATRETYDLSLARYENGVDDFLTVLDSQRALFAAEQGGITIRQAWLSNLINLYKVLGGGQI